jgi:hypothetical protein
MQCVQENSETLYYTWHNLFFPVPAYASRIFINRASFPSTLISVVDRASLINLRIDEAVMWRSTNIS